MRKLPGQKVTILQENFQSQDAENKNKLELVFIKHLPPTDACP